MEMARVAREGVMITEPALSLGTKFAIRLGAAETVEESGNTVHRFRSVEFKNYAAKAGLSAFNQKRYFMYYRQKPLYVFQWFESNPAFILFKIIHEFFNYLIAPWGNKIAVVARRSA